MAEPSRNYDLIKKQIDAGNIREAYKTYETLPIKDQIAISIAPGIGDALAAYEVGEFGRRARTNIQQEDKLGAAGNIALASLSGLSLIPLLRFLRGAKAVGKTATKVADAPKVEDAPIKTEKPPVEERLQLPAPKEPELPEVQEFMPKGVNEITYNMGRGQPELNSKIRKYLNNIKVVDKKINPNLDDLTPEQWVKEFEKLQNKDIFGELRLLNVITETGDIHPKLISSAGPNKTITKQGLDNYIAREQKDALQSRGLDPRSEGYIDDGLAAPMTSKAQHLYWLRAPGSVFNREAPRLANVNTHYSTDSFDARLKGSEHYSFDGYAREFRPALNRNIDQVRDRQGTDATDKIEKLIKDLNISPNDNFSGVVRVQSDYGQKMLPKLKEDTQTSLLNTADRMNLSYDAYSMRSLFKLTYDGEIDYMQADLQAILPSDTEKALGLAIRGDNTKLKSLLGDADYKIFNGRNGVSTSVKKDIEKTTKAFEKELIEAYKKNEPIGRKYSLDDLTADRQELGEIKLGKPDYISRTITKALTDVYTQKNVDVKIPRGVPNVFTSPSVFIRSKGEFYKLKPDMNQTIWNDLPNKKQAYEKITSKEMAKNVIDEMIKESPTSIGESVTSYVRYYTELRKKITPLVEKFLKITPSPGEKFNVLLKMAGVKSVAEVPVFKDATANKDTYKKLLQANTIIKRINAGKLQGTELGEALGDLDAITERFIPSYQITPRDYELATGKPFTDVIDVSKDDIFRMVDTNSGKRAYPGIDYEDDAGLFKAYFDDLNNPSESVFETPKGQKDILKSLSSLTDDTGKPIIDPYTSTNREGLASRGKLPTTSNVGKLPIRAGILRAYNEGADGFYHSMEQFFKESPSTNRADPTDNSKVRELYQRNFKEMEKVINELLPNPKDRVGVISKVEGTDTFYDGTYIKFTDKLKEAIAAQGIDAFAKGGPVISGYELAKEATRKRDELEKQLKNIYGSRIYENLFAGGFFDDLYKEYDAAKNFKESFSDQIEQDIDSLIKFPFKSEIKDILKTDDPKQSLKNRAEMFKTATIDTALQQLNLPVDVRKTQSGTYLNKDIYDGDRLNIDFSGYKPDDGDFTGDIDLRYKDAGRFGNIDIQSTLDELGDINTLAKYGYSQGPINVRAVKYPRRDATGDISYTLQDIGVGKNQTIDVRAVVDNLKRARLNLDYMYKNPSTGGFFDASLGLSSIGSPEFNLRFGREF